MLFCRKAGSRIDRRTGRRLARLRARRNLTAVRGRRQPAAVIVMRDDESRDVARAAVEA